MATNTSVLNYGALFQVGGGTFGAGTTQVSTIAFGGAPSAGSVTLSFWGLPFTFSTAAGVPTAVSFAATLNAIFGTAYATPFQVSLTSNTYTVTADPAGPFAFMPLPAFATVTNTSLQTITHTITVPGVTKETYTTITGVETFPFLNPKADVEVYVTYDLGNNRYKGKMKKFKDAGQLTLSLVFRNDATQNIITGIQSLFESPSAFDFRVAVPTQVANPSQTTQGYQDWFTAFVTQYGSPAATADQRMKLNCLLDVDGAISRYPPIA
jgi:hypothetical protein